MATPHRNKAFTIEVMLHVIVCMAMLAFPFLLASRDTYDEAWAFRLRHMVVTQLAFIAIFYANYLLLVPRLVLKGRLLAYAAANIAIMAATLAAMQIWHDATMRDLIAHGLARPGRPGPPRWLFVARDTFTMMLTIGASIAIRMSKQWAQAEEARKEAERSRTEAELKNLRNQINPHFLLNTLNNIYALIVFDKDKAQEAVQELSRLLRYVLYDNQQEVVPLAREAAFIRDYIELMRIRLPGSTRVTTRIDIAPDSPTLIAPLIFISLIENAFKHGTSPTAPSIIEVSLTEEQGIVTCSTRNSNHPKGGNDMSGSGIGLVQVQARLDLMYGGRYTWQQGIEHDQYVSTLKIDTHDTTADLHRHR